MSHELRTPLNAILGFSEIMSQQLFCPLSNKNLEYTGNILDAGRHLLSLVNDILDLSRIQLGTTNLAVQKVDLVQICTNCIAIVRERAERGEIILTLHRPISIPIIETDERRLKQILVNLLSNAVKFTPPGGTVDLDVEADHRDGVLLKVRDTGVGMNADELEKAGRPFWQADSGLDRAYEGSGPGLALVRELVRCLQATLSLESERQRGTIATISLPPRIDATAEDAEDVRAA